MPVSKRIEQILEVLQAVRAASPASLEAVRQARGAAVRQAAETRGINERSVANKCWRELHRFEGESFHIGDFDALVWDWLDGRPEELRSRCLDGATSNEDRSRVEQFFAASTGAAVVIPTSLSRLHVAAAVRDLDSGGSPHSGVAPGHRLQFGLKHYPAEAVVGLAIGHATGQPVGPEHASERQAATEAAEALARLGLHVDGITETPAADPSRIRDILRVLTPVPIPRGQLRLFRLWLDHHPEDTPSALLSQMLSDGDANVYSGLRAALARRINHTRLAGPDGHHPGLGLLVAQSEGGTERPRPAFWRAVEALPELFDYLHTHDEPWLKAHATELQPSVPDSVRGFLSESAPPAPESFEARRDRFFAWLPGQILTLRRSELHIQAVDDHWVDFAPSETTGRIVLPLGLVEEWLWAAHDGRLGPDMTSREMRDVVKGPQSEWAPLHHGFETQLSGLVHAWWRLPHAPPIQTAQLVDLPTAHAAFRDALFAAGLRFGDNTRHDAFTRAFVASVLTKRFVILTGLSGSGKSQIAMRFGEWLGENRSRVVAVRPDWTSPEALFGFADLLRKNPESGRTPWHTPPTLQFILQAAASDHLHLLVLDEMNLAHVERYFADLLSGMESGKGCVPDVVKDGDDWVLRSAQLNPLPANLVFVGTVNVDETTYMFSPKVLDRANTLEFRVRTDDLPDDISALVPPSEVTSGPPGALEALRRVVTDRRWHLGHELDELAPLGARLNLVDALRVVHWVSLKTSWGLGCATCPAERPFRGSGCTHAPHLRGHASSGLPGS